MLEDLLVAAHADAKQKVEAQMAEEMQKATAGLNLPGGLPGGLKLPFCSRARIGAGHGRCQTRTRSTT